jgi:hypothetical protein
MLNQMTTVFTYLGKKYQVDINPVEWINSNLQSVIKLPTGELLTIEHWCRVDTDSPIPEVISADIEFLVLEAKEVNQEELAFQSLLKEYNLPDNNKTRNLWNKCKILENDGAEPVDWFHELVELIKDD